MKNRFSKHSVQRLGGLLAGFVLLSAFAAQPAWAQKVTDDWEEIYRGVEYAEGSSSSPLQKVYALRVDTHNRYVSFMATPGNGGASGDTNLQTTPDFLEEHELSAAINANYFTWAAGGNANVEGLLISEGDVVSSGNNGGNNRNGQLRITTENAARLANTTDTPTGIHTAIAGSGFVLYPPGNPAGDDETFHPRTGLGLTSDERYIIMVVIDGRQQGYSEGATLFGLGEWLKEFGATIGVNLDGGGSSTFVTEARGVHNSPSDGSPRAVGVNFGLTSAPLTFSGTIEGFHALEFNGNEQFVDITDAASTFDDFTISGWFRIREKKTPEFPESLQFLYRLTNRENNSRMIDLSEENGVLRARFRWAAGGTIYEMTSSDFEYDIWTHIAFVRAGDRLRLYFDGKLAASTPAATGPAVVAKKSYLGGNPHMPGNWGGIGRQFFYGSIDEFQIWNVAKSAIEIRESMFEHLEEVPPQSALHARFGFNEGGEDWAFDYVSGNNFIGVVTEAAWVESEFMALAPLPALTITKDGEQIVLTWENSPQVRLESASDLHPESWSAVPEASSPHHVDQAEARKRFFRLHEVIE